MVNARIGAICLVATECAEMARFYADVFGVAFEVADCEGHAIYSGAMGDVEFTLVPSELSDVSCVENKTHWDIFVDDVDVVIAAVEGSGGKTNGRLMEAEGVRCIGVFDPDGNFMAVKQTL